MVRERGSMVVRQPLRDWVGELIDRYLTTRPAPEMREAVWVLAGAPCLGDRVAGLT